MMFTYRTDPAFSHRSRFKGLFRQFFNLSLVFLLLLLCIRAFEMFYNGSIHGSPSSLTRVIISSAWCDMLFFLKASFVLFWIFLLLYYFSKKLSRTIYILITTLLLLTEMGLVFYFLTALVPLGSDLYGYSHTEIQQTVGAAGSLNLVSLLSFAGLILLIILAFRFLFRKLHLPMVIPLILLFLMGLSWILPDSVLQNPIDFKNDFINNLVLNKINYFIRSSEKHFFPENINIYGNFTGSSLDSIAGIQSFHYTDESHYPFLHSDSFTDVLSPFFRTDSIKPNIVVLLIEGLGRAFTNKGAYLGNFTPFLDSLSGKSLYWSNFMSEGGRTFAVLPSVLGSLPFGAHGFCELGSEMPHQLSLASILVSNGYRANFFYGGDSHFDNMDTFMKRQGATINDINTFGPGYKKMPESTSGFTWGYGDKELFRRYFSVSKLHAEQPRVDILLTLSTHNPFFVDNENYYLSYFEQRMNELHFTPNEKAQHEDYKLQYASILFMDDALQWFFEQYRQRPDYKHTIFLITGDHRMPEIPMSTKIDRYHVPLIIYSPLLKRNATFRSISTHFDITPSLLAFLKKEYDIRSPASADWIGTGLDTTRSFRNVHAYPFMQTKGGISDFIAGSWMLHGSEDLYRIMPDMGLKREDNPKVMAEIVKIFSRFNVRNNSFIRGAQLIPDSLYQKYSPGNNH